MLLVLLQREVISSSKVAVLPTTYQALPAQAVEYSLACAQLPRDVSHVRLLFGVLLLQQWCWCDSSDDDDAMYFISLFSAVKDFFNSKTLLL